MILYEDLYYYKEKIISAPLDLNIEFNYTPNNLWLIGIHNKDANENFELLYYRKVIQVVFGYYEHNNNKINIVLAQYIVNNNISSTIIQFECATNGNYYPKSFDGLIELDYASQNLLIDIDELQIIPDFKGKSLLECINTIVSNHPDYTDLFRFYKLDSNKIVNQIEFNKL